MMCSKSLQTLSSHPDLSLRSMKFDSRRCNSSKTLALYDRGLIIVLGMNSCVLREAASDA